MPRNTDHPHSGQSGELTLAPPSIWLVFGRPNNAVAIFGVKALSLAVR